METKCVECKFWKENTGSGSWTDAQRAIIQQYGSCTSREHAELLADEIGPEVLECYERDGETGGLIPWEDSDMAGTECPNWEGA